MGADVSSREAAITWTKRRIRKLGVLMIVAVVLAPVASMIVVGWRYFRRAKELPPIGPLLTSSLLWSVVAIALMGIVAVLIGLKYMKFAKRAGPILGQGTEQTGTVTDVQHSSRRAGGVNHHAVTLVVQTADGGTLTAKLEESEGTDLPRVDLNAPAKVWTLQGRSIIGTSGALFETHPG